ncbi:MAG: thiamine ABC transporter substrate-binding protein [Rectinemataceae bacterium]
MFRRILSITIICPLVAAFCAATLLSCARPTKELVVWSYDSFVSEYGPGQKLAELFGKETGVQVGFVSKGDGGQLLWALAFEADQPVADIAIGLDNLLLPKALSLGLFSPYRPKGLDAVDQVLRIDPSNRLVPFDYGYFAIIYDSKRTKELPASLADFTKSAYAKQLILMDPRTSTPGLGFLGWTKAVYGTGLSAYWKGLVPSILVMTPGWDTGYGLFTSGEAPFVLSYTTSPAYHREVEKTDRYKVLSLAEGNPLEVELAGILKGAKNRSNAERFMDFLLSAEAQALLPSTQWMYPARSGTPLPSGFRDEDRPAKVLTIDAESLVAEAAALMAEIARTR